MASYRRSEIISGLFVTLAAVVFGLFAFKVGRFDLMGLLKDEAITCRTYFTNVKTLQVGSKVRVGGREVGEVTDLVLVESPTPEGAQDPGGLKRLVNEVTFELVYPELRHEITSWSSTRDAGRLISRRPPSSRPSCRVWSPSPRRPASALKS